MLNECPLINFLFGNFLYYYYYFEAFLQCFSVRNKSNTVPKVSNPAYQKHQIVEVRPPWQNTDNILPYLRTKLKFKDRYDFMCATADSFYCAGSFINHDLIIVIIIIEHCMLISVLSSYVIMQSRLPRFHLVHIPFY